MILSLSGCDEQRADPDFDARVEDPAYLGGGPRVLFDEGHHNFHTSIGRYKPFVDLVRSDGYQVTPVMTRFTPAILQSGDLLVIANALGAEGIQSPEAARPAFTDAECKAIREWVEGGRSLLLITDHYPTGLAAKPLADAFGVYMSSGTSGHFEFTPERGLADHPIMRGRGPREAIRRIRTYTGQSLNGPAESAALLVLPETAMEDLPDRSDPFSFELTEGPAMYPHQAIAMRCGQGRVVILGEAAVLSAQVRRGRTVGMNQAEFDNRQFALNIMHWLSGLIPPEGSEPPESGHVLIAPLAEQ